MYVKPFEIHSKGLIRGDLALSNFVSARRCVYEKLEKRSLWSIVGRPRRLLIGHPSPNSQMLGLLCHVIVVNVEHHLLSQFSLNQIVGLRANFALNC